MHIEVRRRGEWHLMTFLSPFWETDNEYPIFNTEVYNCRYHHFREFLNEAPSQRCGNKDVLSEELLAKMTDATATGAQKRGARRRCAILPRRPCSGIPFT